MRKYLKKKPSASMGVALIALFIALSGTTYAATGGNFILGNTNSAGKTTSLSAPFAGKALQVTNSSTAVGAAGIGITVAPNRAPLVVNSGTRVANLNADKIDGIDSTGFVKGKGTVYGNRLVVSSASGQTILTVPGFASITAGRCDSVAYAAINGPAPVTVWRDEGSATPDSFDLDGGSWSWNSETTEPGSTTFHLARGTGPTAQAATIEIWTHVEESTGSCVYSATAEVFG